MPLFRVGILLGSFGVKGHAKFAYCTDQPELLRTRKHYLLADLTSGEALQVTLEDASLQPQHFTAKLDVFSAPEQIPPYARWNLLHAAPRGAMQRGADEVFCFELMGLAVRDGQGQPLGVVTEVIDSGAHWLLGLDTLPSRLIPYTRQFVPEVNLEQGYLVCTYPLGEVVDP